MARNLKEKVRTPASLTRFSPGAGFRMPAFLTHFSAGVDGAAQEISRRFWVSGINGTENALNDAVAKPHNEESMT